MEEENKNKNKEEQTKDNTGKLSFKTADELTSFLLDLQGQVINMQETIDKLTPVEEENKEQTEEQAEEMTDEEINEIDQLLQSE